MHKRLGEVRPAILDSPAKARKQNFPTDDLESNVSSETEGPDTHSYLSGSSDTEGPDTDHRQADR